MFERHWQPIDLADGVPSRLYRASFSFSDLPMVSQAGVARQGESGWVGRNERIPNIEDQPDPKWSRAVPMLFGAELDPLVRATELGLPAYSLRPTPMLADHDIPEGQATEYAVWASDTFGRFPEDTAIFTVEPPPRPKPPPPVLRFHFERAPGEIAPGQSPGTLTITVAVPEPLPAAEPFADRSALSSAVVVPRLDDLPAGAFDLVALQSDSTASTKASSSSTPVPVSTRRWWTSPRCRTPTQPRTPTRSSLTTATAMATTAPWPRRRSRCAISARPSASTLAPA